MRALHSAALLAPPPGILAQMRWEQHAARQLGIDLQVRMFCPKGAASPEETVVFARHAALVGRRLRKFAQWVILRWEYHRWLASMADDVDIYILRYYVHDPFQLLFLAICRKPVYLVHHTLEVPELRSAGGLGGLARSVLEATLGKLAIRVAAGTIAVTREIAEYEISRSGQRNRFAHIYPNGIVYSDQAIRDERGTVPEFLFVAGSFVDWHGLDLLLDALLPCNSSFVLHLVGEVSPLDRARCAKDERVRLHGSKTQTEISEIAARCWLGLASFALFRKGMHEACTLKVREYLTLGLPVYAGHADIFPANFAYYENGKLSASNILRFAFAHRGTPRGDVSGAARQYIDKTALVKGLHTELAEDIKLDVRR